MESYRLVCFVCRIIRKGVGQGGGNLIEKKESRIKYIGQIIALFGLEILILLFRIAVPLRATMVGPFQWLIGEVLYMVVECFLIIILVNHLIFKNSYKEMGFTNFKDNVFSLIGNLCYLGIAAGMTYGLNYISGEKNSNSMNYIVSHVIILFISTAFLQETIFRGCILNNLLKVTRRKVFLSIIIGTLLFMIVHIPLTMLGTNFESLFKGQTNELIGLSFGMGIYLSLLYYWTKNLWICMIIHGTYSCLDVVATGLLRPAFKGVYILGALIYLLYIGIQSMKAKTLEGDQDDDNNESDERSVSNEGDKEDQEDKNDQDDKEARDIKSDEDHQEEVEMEVEVSSTKASELHKIEKPLDYQIIQGIEDLQVQEKVSLGQETNNKEIKNLPTEEQKKDLNQTTIIKIAEIEAADKALKIEQLTSPQHKVNTVKFKEEPSYINHLEQALGEFENIYKQVIPTDPPIDILSFQGERFNALVTNGMRYLPMNVPGYMKGDAHAELVMFIDKSFDISDEGLLKEENSWLLQSLRDLAMYPRLNNSYLGWGHVVGNGEERMPYYSGSKFCGMLIYPPIVQEDMKFYTFKEGEKTTYIYNVMPLYTEEIDFILKYSSETYFDRMRESGISQIIKKNRLNICLE